MENLSTKISFNLFWWETFNPIKYNLYKYLLDIGMYYEFAFKKVKKMNTEECVNYQAELNKTSKAYKMGYSDGDYWNGSQNPYSPKLSPRNYFDYEQGFNTCKEDKIKHSENFLIKKTINDTSRRI